MGVNGLPRLADVTRTAYAGRHPMVPVPAADPGANRLDWYQDIRPRVPVAVPLGCLAVKLANAGATSAGNHAPGDVAVLPDAEARALLRQGYAREVLAA